MFDNQSSDSLLVSMYIGQANNCPHGSYQFHLVQPDSVYVVETFTELWIDQGNDWQAWVVRKSRADEKTLDTIIKYKMYDSVYRYSYAELENRKFTITVNPNDFD